MLDAVPKNAILGWNLLSNAGLHFNCSCSTRFFSFVNICLKKSFLFRLLLAYDLFSYLS